MGVVGASCSGHGASSLLPGGALGPDDVAGLELTMPETASADTTVRLVLLARPDRVLAEGVGRIEYRAPPKQTPAPVATEVPESPQVLLRRGVELLAAGDAAAARKSLQTAAERGDPDAAFYLAMTFDPHFYARLGVGNLAPDIEQARRWYRVAAANGSADADKRLKELAK